MNPIILAFETSCDETAVAVVRGSTEALSNVLSSQVDLHARFGGVVPEIAAQQVAGVVSGDGIETAVAVASTARAGDVTLCAPSDGVGAGRGDWGRATLANGVACASSRAIAASRFCRLAGSLSVWMWRRSSAIAFFVAASSCCSIMRRLHIMLWRSIGTATSKKMP